MTSPHGRRGVHLPTLVGGALAGVLLCGALFPILGRDAGTRASTDAGPRTVSTLGPAGAVDGVTSTTAGSGVAPGAGPTATTPGSTAPRSATERGVTADVIKVGIPIYDGASAKKFGADVTDQQQHIAEAFRDDLNGRGGILGRRVETVFANYDFIADALTGGTSQNRACLDLTQGAKVFAVLSTPLYLTADCVYQANRTFLIGGSGLQVMDDPSAFDAAGGRVWTIQPSGARLLTSLGEALAKDPRLAGKRIGIASAASTLAPAVVDSYLVPALGTKPVHVSRLAADQATFTAQLQIEVGRMRDAGADVVVMLMGPIQLQLWLQQAEANGWTPRYAISDIGGLSLDSALATNGGPPASFQGALGFSTYAHGARRASDQRCFAIWERAKGAPTAVNEELDVTDQCNLWLAFERAATAAGVGLTTPSLIRGAASIGQLPLAGYAGPTGSFGGRTRFGPTKWSAADTFEPIRWDTGCRCFRVDGAPVRMGA